MIHVIEYAIGGGQYVYDDPAEAIEALDRWVKNGFPDAKLRQMSEEEERQFRADCGLEPVDHLDAAVTELRKFCNKKIAMVNKIAPSHIPFFIYNNLLRECDKVFRAQDKMKGV